MKLQEASELYFESINDILSKATIKIYRNAIDSHVAFLGPNREIASVRPMDVLKWRTHLAQAIRFDGHPLSKSGGKLSVHTIRRMMTTVRTFWTWLVDYELVEKSPARAVKLPQAPKLAPKAISREGFQKLLEEAAKYSGNKEKFRPIYEARNRAIVMFLASTGCRVGGLCSAELTTLDLENGTVDVIEKFKGGGKQHTVYLTPTAIDALKGWLAIRPDCDHNFIFCAIERSYEPMTPRSVGQMMRRAAQRAGLEGNYSPHAFRHAAAREWLNNGASLATVSQLLNHSGIEVTAKFYARFDKRELQAHHKQCAWV